MNTDKLSAVLASDFSPSTADHLRNYWDAGKFRALGAALPDGHRILLTTDAQTGHTVEVELLGVQVGNLGGRVVVRHHYPAGFHDTAYRCRSIGPAVIVEGSAKWDALAAYRRMVAECIDVVRAEHGEADGQAWGTWSAHLTVTGAYVKYEPSTGNAAFRDQWGQQVTAEVWRERDGALTAHNVRKHPPRVVCDLPVV